MRASILRLCLLSVFWAMTLPALAQSQPIARDYSIVDTEYRFNEDSSLFIIGVEIENKGADATAETNIVVISLNDGSRVIAEDRVPPLANSGMISFEFEFATADYPPSSRQVFQIEVGIDSFELARSPIAEDNVREITVQIPAGAVPRPAPTSASGEAGPAPGEAGAEAAPLFAFENGEFIFGETRIPQDQALIIAVGAGLLLLLLWLVTIVLRLIFRKPKRFPNWQAPYSTVPMLDPNSVAGRRQAWQLHAQNGSLLAATTEGNLHPLKLLLNREGVLMKGWHITGLRMNQYDAYGRVPRSQMIASNRLVRRLDKLLQKNDQLEPEALSKQINGLVRQLVRQFRKRVNKRNAFLPIALDIRFEGPIGEVNIVFELYQFQQYAWHRIDQWQPDINAIGRLLQENYTYTIHGMGPGETSREFNDRLQEDLAWLLNETLASRMPRQQQSVRQDEFSIPDTLTGMKPIGESASPYQG